MSRMKCGILKMILNLSFIFHARWNPFQKELYSSFALNGDD